MARLHLTLTLHAILRDYRPSWPIGGPVELELDDSVTVRAVAGQLGIPENALYLAVLNGKPVPLAARLVDGGHLQLFPPVVGG